MVLVAITSPSIIASHRDKWRGADVFLEKRSIPNVPRVKAGLKREPLATARAMQGRVLTIARQRHIAHVHLVAKHTAEKAFHKVFQFSSTSSLRSQRSRLCFFGAAFTIAGCA